MLEELTDEDWRWKQTQNSSWWCQRKLFQNTSQFFLKISRKVFSNTKYLNKSSTLGKINGPETDCENLDLKLTENKVAWILRTLDQDWLENPKAWAFKGFDYQYWKVQWNWEEQMNWNKNWTQLWPIRERLPYMDKQVAAVLGTALQLLGNSLCL